MLLGFRARLIPPDKDVGVPNLVCCPHISAARSPTMTQGAMVFPVVTRGIIEPSAPSSEPDLSIGFGDVGTHNNFHLDPVGKVFDLHAPLINAG